MDSGLTEGMSKQERFFRKVLIRMFADVGRVYNPENKERTRLVQFEQLDHRAANRLPRVLYSNRNEGPENPEKPGEQRGDVVHNIYSWRVRVD